MSIFLRRILGVLLILTAFGGLAFSIFGISGVWQVKPTLTEALISSVALTSDTLETTSAGLAMIDETLRWAVGSMQSLQNALETTANTLESTEPMLRSVIDLMDQELPATIRATRTSLDSAQESAKIIHSVLDALSIFPFVNYDPDKPLYESLNEISNRLGEFPASFENISGSLDASQEQLQILQADLAMIGEAVSQIEISLDESEKVLAQYKESVDTALTKLASLEERIPVVIEGAVWTATLFLVWMAFAQIGLFIQGVNLLSKAPEPDWDPEDLST